MVRGARRDSGVRTSSGVGPLPQPRAQTACLRSPFAHAEFRIVDTAAASQMEGVVAVLTAAEIDSVCKGWQCASRAYPGLVSPPQHALARDRAAYQGEPVAMVVATSRARAEDAVERIEVE